MVCPRIAPTVLPADLLGISCCFLVADSVMPETRNDRRKRQCTHASSPSPHQHVHRPWLKADIYASDYNQQHSEDSRVLEETVVPVADGRSKEYCDWWRDHSTGRDNLGGLGVRLIGDASSPELFTSMAHNDLAYSRCSCRCTPSFVSRST